MIFFVAIAVAAGVAGVLFVAAAVLVWQVAVGVVRAVDQDG